MVLSVGSLYMVKLKHQRIWSPIFLGRDREAFSYKSQKYDLCALSRLDANITSHYFVLGEAWYLNLLERMVFHLNAQALK